MQLRSRGRFEVNTVFPLFSDHRIIKVVSDVECLCSLQLIIRQQCVVASAWRLIEIVRSRSGSRRRMLCFTSMEDVTRAVEERCAWQRADEQFVATHMATPGGFPGVTADWVPSKDFDLMFGSSREAIRRQMCLTSPDHTVTLA